MCKSMNSAQRAIQSRAHRVPVSFLPLPLVLHFSLNRREPVLELPELELQGREGMMWGGGARG
jgi:hypothetical protein